MTKYGYTLNSNTNLVEQSVIETYPKNDILERSIENGSRAGLIKKQKLKAIEGEHESTIVDMELKWFKKQQLVETLEAEVKTITDKLNGVSEVIDPITNEITTVAVEQVTDEDEVVILTTRLESINDKNTNHFDDAGVKQTTVIKGELSLALEARASLEKEFGWLVGYRGLETTTTRPEVSSNIKLTRKDAKKLIAYERDTDVRNSEDSIADLAKMISLSFSAISALWVMVSEEDKAALPPEKKAVIDYAVSKFNDTVTRADEQLAVEGTKLIDKLYSREVNIAGIVRRYN